MSTSQEFPFLGLRDSKRTWRQGAENETRHYVNHRLLRVQVMAEQQTSRKSFTWLILGIAISGIIAVLAVPYAIGQHGISGLWIPAVLLIPILLQAAAAFKLKPVANPSR